MLHELPWVGRRRNELFPALPSFGLCVAAEEIAINDAPHFLNASPIT
jgi:hypothetical protein